MTELELFSAGVGRPKGSKRMVRTKGGRTLLLEDSGREGPRRRTLSADAALAMQGRERFVGVPLWVLMVFGFPRPQSHYTKKGLRPGAPEWHIGAPDASKLARSVEDALNGIVWDDDSRIAWLTVVKHYCGADEVVGIALLVSACVTWQLTHVDDDPTAFYRRLAGAGATPPQRPQLELVP